jgi:transcriptional regulator with XRE-family HTH domain
MDSKEEKRGLDWTIGSNLDRLVKSAHLTVEQFAEAMDVSPRTVEYWFYGNKEPALVKLIKAAALLGVTLNDLVH